MVPSSSQGESNQQCPLAVAPLLGPVDEPKVSKDLSSLMQNHSARCAGCSKKMYPRLILSRQSKTHRHENDYYEGKYFHYVRGILKTAGQSMKGH